MRSNKLKSKLDDGGVALGTFIGLGVPAIVEMIGLAGYDFVVVDLEHTALDVHDVEALTRAADAVNLTTLVRVPAGDWMTAARIVELGVGGVMAPHIQTAEDARALVRTVKYPPVGDRGLDVTTRSSGYGQVDPVKHVEQANEHMLAIVLVEDREGIEQIDEILDVDGIDIAITGPADLSRSYGVPGEIRHELVETAIQRFLDASAARGIHTMRAAFRPEDVEEHVSRGVTLVTSPLNDAHFIGQGLRDFHDKATRYAASGLRRRSNEEEQDNE